MLEALLVIIWGAAIAASRRFLDSHMGIPGSTGFFWLGLLISGKLVVKRDFSALSMGATAALWGIPMGIGQSLPYNLALYSAVGVAVDLLARAPLMRLDTPLGAGISGALAHLVKLGFITGYAASFGLYRNFLELGLVISAGYHILFGALGGLAAVGVIGIAGWKRARKSQP